MLTILGNKSYGRFCDGMPRRDFMTIGGMLLGGLAMPTMLQAEAQRDRGHKAIINIFLPGGPPHLDMWDLKPDAPAEIRGEFKPIKTSVSGIEICELFPRMAAMMDKFAIIRSLSDSDGDHSAYQCMTGRKKGPQDPPGGWPALGAWVSKVKGQVSEAIPAHVSLMYKTGHAPWGETGSGGYLGMAHDPFRLVGGRDNLNKSDNMVLKGITLDRLQDRDQLRRSLDTFRREADTVGAMSGLDTFNEKALGILTSSALADALDLSQEDPEVVARYGVDDPAFERDGAPRMVRNFCIARRLVEAGARVVTMNFTRWDWHGGDGMNFVQARKDFPLLDVALSTLVEDLEQRGMLKDVSIVVWGEFGRTPKINNMNSRDHWPQANACVLAGGGMRTGQVIGSTNKYGEHPVDRPVKFQEVFATLYQQAGVSLNTRQFDLRGRPQYLVDSGIEPMRELV
jgi:hypothetical protein